MNVGFLSNIGGSVAGTSLAQLRGSDVDRSQQDSNARELRVQSDEKAELAAGVGQADGEDHQTADRDADGRQLWQLHNRPGQQQDASGTSPQETRSIDPTGQSGNMLDLTG
jgi:hypothetical protein